MGLSTRALRDGFVETGSMDRHQMKIQGMKVISVGTDDIDRGANAIRRRLVLSWDMKNAILSEQGRVIRDLKFGNSKESSLSCLTFSVKMRTFIAASLAMTFRIYDYKMKLLEVINHNERMITAMEYDVARDVVVICGSGGI